MNDTQSTKPLLNRRQFVVGASAVALAPLISSNPAFAEAQALPPLDVIDARTTPAFQLKAMAGATDFYPGVPSPTMGFNQAYLGPVLRLRTGTSVQATVQNATQETITSHWHGLLVPGEVDGGPHNAIPPGGIWQPVLGVDQPSATLWYHTHVHGETAQRVYAGLAGVLIIDDGLDDERGLPTTFAEDDLVLVVQDRRFDAAGVAAYEPTPSDKFHGFLGNTIIVNGVPSPMASVPQGIVRLRLLNASNGRNFELFFDDGRLVHLIASDHLLGDFQRSQRHRNVDRHWRTGNPAGTDPDRGRRRSVSAAGGAALSPPRRRRSPRRVAALRRGPPPLVTQSSYRYSITYGL